MKPDLMGVYSQNNLQNTIEDGVYKVNLDEYKSIGTLWIALYANGNGASYFDNFGVEQIPEEVKRSIGYNNIITDTFKMRIMSR